MNHIIAKVKENFDLRYIIREILCPIQQGYDTASNIEIYIIC